MLLSEIPDKELVSNYLNGDKSFLNLLLIYIIRYFKLIYSRIYQII